MGIPYPHKGVNMRITVLSDLHLEFSPLEPVLTSSDVLILAGDIFVLESLRRPEYRSRLDQFLSGLSDHYDKVYSITGNHEYYGSDIRESDDQIREIYQSYGIHFLQNECDMHDGIKFIGTTLWTHVDPVRSVQIQSYMNDYNVIKRGDHRLVVNNIDQMHHMMRLYLEERLSESNDPTVVITHHAPSYGSISKYYQNPQNSLMNSAFANKMDSVMYENPHIRLWCHGHVHNSFDYMVDNTRVVCNPRGYPTEHQYADWDRNHQIVVDRIV
jgi:predicted phosphodiesterase